MVSPVPPGRLKRRQIKRKSHCQRTLPNLGCLHLNPPPFKKPSRSTTKRHFSLIFAISLILPWAHAGNASRRSPDQVLLVVNSNSPISSAIGTDYAQKRRVTNVLSIQCQDSAV